MGQLFSSFYKVVQGIVHRAASRARPSESGIHMLGHTPSARTWRFEKLRLVPIWSWRTTRAFSHRPRWNKRSVSSKEKFLAPAVEESWRQRESNPRPPMVLMRTSTRKNTTRSIAAGSPRRARACNPRLAIGLERSIHELQAMQSVESEPEAGPSLQPTTCYLSKTIQNAKCKPRNQLITA